jgi:hypothetical protein
MNVSGFASSAGVSLKAAALTETVTFYIRSAAIVVFFSIHTKAGQDGFV